MRTVAAGGRLYEWAEPLASLLDVALPEAQAQLDRLDMDGPWVKLGPSEPWVQPAISGPALKDAMTVFTRVSAGGCVPMHKHLGEERVLLVQGRCKDQLGQDYHAGDELWMAPGSTHSFTVEPEAPDLIFAMALFGGIEVLSD